MKLKQKINKMENFREKMLSISNENIQNSISKRRNNKSNKYNYKMNNGISNKERSTIIKVMSQMIENFDIGNRNIQHRKKKEVGYW